MNYLLTRKGQIVTIKTRRQVKMKKSHQEREIFKESTMQVQVGISYDNKKAVQEKRGIGLGQLPAQNAGLPWGEWEEFPYTIRHNGKRYFRLYPIKNNFKKISVFVESNKEVPLEEVKGIALASEFRDDEKDCFVIEESCIVEAK